jgi:hypothetical protein
MNLEQACADCAGFRAAPTATPTARSVHVDEKTIGAAQDDLRRSICGAGRTANGLPHVAPIGRPLTDLDIVTH